MIIDAFENRLFSVADGKYYRGYPESEDYYSSDSDMMMVMMRRRRRTMTMEIMVEIMVGIIIEIMVGII